MDLLDDELDHLRPFYCARAVLVKLCEALVKFTIAKVGNTSIVRQVRESVHDESLGLFPVRGTRIVDIILVPYFVD